MSCYFISVQDLTATVKHPDYPRNVSLQVEPEKGRITLLGILNHGTELGIDQHNARELIKILEPIAHPPLF